MKNITLPFLLAILSIFGLVSLSFAVAIPTMPDTSSTTSGIVFPSAPPRPIMPLPSDGICPVDCICYPATSTPTTTPPTTPGGGSETTGVFSAGFGNTITGTVVPPSGGGGGGGTTVVSGGGGGGGVVPISSGGGGTVLGTQTFNPSGVPVEDLGGTGGGEFPDMPNTALGDERDLFYALLLLIVSLVEVPFLINKLSKRLKMRNETPKYI